MQTIEEIKEIARNYFLENVLDPASAKELTDSTPLISGGILDSVTTLQFISFVEEKFGIQIEPQEVDQDNLNTISLIANFVQSKLDR